MARLTGLASEHHHEGPGDAPRRKRGRASKKQTASEDAPASKRTVSPTAESSQTKRAKRVKIDDDEDEVDEEIDELQQSVSRRDDDDTVHVVTQASTKTTTHRSGRRHSEPLVVIPQSRETNTFQVPSTQPVAGLTPHLDRTGASRTRFTNNRRSRMSMPAQLPVERIDEVEEGGTRVQFAPLTAVLDNRTRRRLRRSHLSQEIIDVEDHKKKDKKLLLDLRRQLREQDETIKNLEFRLEARRLGDIDITEEHAQELEQQLEQARQQIDELRASSLYNGEDSITNISEDVEDEEDGLLLVNPDELHYSQDLDMEHHAPDGKYASRVLELSSQVTFESLPRLSQLTHDTLMEEDDQVIPDKIEDRAVERYERELQHYIALLAESQGALRVITIELQNLNFIEAGAATSDILTQLRRSFDTLRAEVEKYFPHTTSGLTNQELLRKVPELFSGIFFELKEKLTLISTSQKTEILLRRQYEGVLDLLGESEERVQQLERDLHTLDKTNETKQRTILDLEERVTTLTELANSQEATLKENEAQIHGLQDETEDKDTSLSRLREAIETYRKDLEQVTRTATAFEEEHHETITRMELEHAEAVQELQTELEAETEGREAAEAEAQQQREYIEELETRIASMESDVDIITSEMATLRERLAAQHEAREAAEGERDEQAELVYQHTNTMEDLNEAIAELKDQIAEFRDNLATERTQREKTEADLDEANEKIEDLSTRLHNTGIQANELRSKLFQLQQEKTEAITQLQEESQDREDDLNQQLADEAGVRGAAEAKVIELEQHITDLQENLTTYENDLAEMTEARAELEQDRDIQVENLTVQFNDLKNKYTALENSTNSTITSLQANITDLNNQVQRQQAEIKRLSEEIAEKDRIYEEDTTSFRLKIEQLEDDLDTQKAENEGYRQENASLSQRVEDEASELLNMADSHTLEVTARNNVIATQEATIKNLEAVSTKRQAEYEDELEERTREVTELQLMGDARAETILILETTITDLKERFAASEEDTRITIDTLMDSQRQLQEQNEQLAAALKARNAEALKAVQEMKLRRIEVKTQGVDLHRVAMGKVVKTSEKVKVAKKGRKKVAKRQWDSGFGVDENVEEAGEVDGEELVAA